MSRLQAALGTRHHRLTIPDHNPPVLTGHEAQSRLVLAGILARHQEEIKTPRLKSVSCCVSGMAAFAWGVKPVLRERVAADYKIQQPFCRERSLARQVSAQRFLMNTEINLVDAAERSAPGVSSSSPEHAQGKVPQLIPVYRRRNILAVINGSIGFFRPLTGKERFQQGK